MRTYDVHFNDNENSNKKGFKVTRQYCITYINAFNGTSSGYFPDYKGGTVSVVCNETGETVYEENIN